ncbi:hypothetical protein C7974DRAFT_345641, partial [Boeremia exigua]|uniref:uncharacterized protein n=1 Tax=Boeremia exigua TaxID=749465 RepID=UPI001E8DC286
LFIRYCRYLGGSFSARSCTRYFSQVSVYRFYNYSIRVPHRRFSITVPPPAPAFCTSVTPDCPVEGTIYGYYPLFR